MTRRPKLSASKPGRRWIKQFAKGDQAAAAEMLDTLLLLNEEEVSATIRGLLQRFADERSGRRKRVALYVEREFPERLAFEVRSVRDAAGVFRRRAVGRSGPAALKPVRGSTRIGSEGLIAFIISQSAEAWPRVYANQPGPDRIRNANNPISVLAIVTDFVGSGTRICAMLDKFWNVPTVRSWVSRKWIEFMVVAAAGTSRGMENVRAHRLIPRLLVGHVAPTVFNVSDAKKRKAWRALIHKYGPANASKAKRYGFQRSGALIAFSYRIPNNTPLIFHKSEGRWHALYNGAAPHDLRAVFGLEAAVERIARAAATIGMKLAPDLSLADAKTVLALGAVRGRWRSGAEIAIGDLE